MRQHWWIPLAALAALTWQAPAQAQDENLFDRLDKNKDGQLSRDEIDEERQRLFERLVRDGDKNGDGKLSKEEFAAATRNRDGENRTERPAEGRPGPANVPAPREIFARFDSNQDGKLSKEEIPERMRENFDRMDRNRDGSVDLEELREAMAVMQRRAGGAPGGNPGPEMLERFFTERDANKDGKLTKDEMPEERREMFARLLERLDEDRDGALTKEQFIRGVQAFGQRPEGAPRRPDAPEGRRPGAPGTPATPEGRRPDAPETRRSDNAENRPMAPLFAALDTDGDGTLSAEEIAAATQALAKLDRNGDGKITRDELAPPRNRQ